MCDECPEYEWNYIDIRVQEKIQSYYNSNRDLSIGFMVASFLSILLAVTCIFQKGNLIIVLCIAVFTFLLAMIFVIPSIIEDKHWQNIDDNAEYINVPIWKVINKGTYSRYQVYYAVCFINGEKYVYKIKSDLSNYLYIISSENKSCVIDYNDFDH